MQPTMISTSGLAQTLRRAIVGSQSALAEAQTEVQTGRRADAGLSLGSGIGQSLALRLEQGQLAAVSESNQLVATQLTASQAALTSIVETAQGFVSVLAAARSSVTGPGTAEGTARAALAALAGQLNTSVGGVHVFGGTNIGDAPFKGSIDAGGGAGAAFATSFQAAFGVAPGTAGAETISAAAMSSFLDVDFASEFADAAWAANWSNASGTNMTARIAPGETVSASVDANEAAFRKLAGAFTMVASLGVERLSRDAFRVVADKALTLAQDAIGEVADLQSALGITQQRVASAQDREALRTAMLTKAIDGLEGVDAYDAAMRVSQWQTQLETAFSLTGRLQKLSLLNYL